MNTEKIGKFIAKKRKEKNYTQKELANKLSVTDRAVSKWERGMGCPDISLLEDLSKILDISIVELLNGEEKENIEIIEKDIINSMKYSKTNTKNEIINNLNIILSTLIIFTVILLLSFNIFNSYKLNKVEKDDYNDPYVTQKSVKNIENYINIIKSNKGKYNEEDYKNILKYVNNLEQLLRSNYLYQNTFKAKDYYKFIEYYNQNLYTKYNGLNKSLYYILIKYDQNIIDNMLLYETKNDNIKDMYIGVESVVLASYTYNFKNINLYHISSIMRLICNQEENLLKDVIEVGDMNV